MIEAHQIIEGIDPKYLTVVDSIKEYHVKKNR